jgi:hypothetical protein
MTPVSGFGRAKKVSHRSYVAIMQLFQKKLFVDRGKGRFSATFL